MQQNKVVLNEQLLYLRAEEEEVEDEGRAVGEGERRVELVVDKRESSTMTTHPWDGGSMKKLEG